jgi:phosphotriesterase-related protein
MGDDAGTVVTVHGPIQPDELGITLPHEHLFADWHEKFEEPESARHRKLAREPISLDNLWFVRQNPTQHLDNLRLDSIEDAVAEAKAFGRAGGGTLVEVTPKNTGMDPVATRAVARETGVNVVKGTSFYYHDAHPERVAEMSVEELTVEFVEDVHDGIGDTDVRAGIIGEIGLSTDEQNGRGNPAWIHEQEEQVLRAGARAALETGASISIHPPGKRDPEYPPSERTHEVLDVCESEGLPASRVIMGHMDQSRWVDDNLDIKKELADRGVILEYDLFDHERYMFDAHDGQPSDWDRVDDVEQLVADGYQENLILSHDIYFKFWWRTYGGNGWTYILDTILPVLRDRGVSRDAIDDIVIENPKRLLTFE